MVVNVEDALIEAVATADGGADLGARYIEVAREDLARRVAREEVVEVACAEDGKEVDRDGQMRSAERVGERCRCRSEDSAAVTPSGLTADAVRSIYRDSPSTRPKYFGRSMTSGSVNRSGCHASVSISVSGDASLGRHRSTSRPSTSMIQYSGTPFR